MKPPNAETTWDWSGSYVRFTHECTHCSNYSIGGSTSCCKKCLTLLSISHTEKSYIKLCELVNETT